MTAGQIASAAGVGNKTVYAHARGNLPKIRRDTAHRILAVTCGQSSPNGHVPALGTIRRTRALYAAGYGATLIATAAGMATSAVVCIVDGHRATVSVHTRDAITHAYRRLAPTPGTSSRARQRAEREGSAGPDYWDEEDFDNPDFTPATVDPDGKLERARITAEEIQHLASFGLPADEIAARVGRSPKYVQAQLAGGRAPGWRQQDKTLAA